MKQMKTPHAIINLKEDIVLGVYFAKPPMLAALKRVRAAYPDGDYYSRPATAEEIREFAA